MIRGLVPKERLLEWSVEDGGEPLCRFLGKEPPPPGVLVPASELRRGEGEGLELKVRMEVYYFLCLARSYCLGTLQ